MAANLTPQYHRAEAQYRSARSPLDKLAALEEMWRELPKHKSTEKIQAELKKKLSAARKALQQGGSKGASKADPFAIAKSGAGQVVLLGAPNVGKSAIVGALTHAHVQVADYPFSTPLPVPGMVQYEDIQIQLIDTPPVTADHVPPGFPGLWRLADALIVVSDLGSAELLDDVDMCLNHLQQRGIKLANGPRRTPDDPEAPLVVPGLVLANKVDLPATAEPLDMLREMLGVHVRIEAISTLDENQLGRVPGLLFKLIDVIRVYSKPPGKKPDLAEPFVLPAGSDVHAMARSVYRGFENQVISARLWGHGVHDGQNVHLDHVLHDKDVVELHA